MKLRQPFEGDYPITLGFGEAVEGLYKSGGHKGIDYGCPTGTPVLAVADGEVVYTSYESGGYGYHVIIRHEDGIGSIYAHLSSYCVKEGDKVKAGQRIGLSGNTGNSTGSHLHLELRKVWQKPSTAFDPAPIMLPSKAEETIVNTESFELTYDTVNSGTAMIGCSFANVRKISDQSVITTLPYGTAVKITDNEVQYFNGLPYRVCLIPCLIAEHDNYGNQILKNL